MVERGEVWQTDRKLFGLSVIAGMRSMAAPALLAQDLTRRQPAALNETQFDFLRSPMTAVLFAGLGLSPNFYVYLVLMFLAGIPMPFLNVPATTLLQEMVPPDMQGRVFSVQMLIVTSVMPFGMLLFGPISDVVAIETLLVLSGAAMAIPGLWIFFNRQLKVAASVLPSRELEIQAGD